VLKRTQFPVKLAFGMTINKSQGQSMKKVGIYLPKPVFSHGQLYVGCGRSGIPDQTKFLIEPFQPEQGTLEKEGNEKITYTQNVVWHEVLTSN
jgi:hypothetical protein